MYIEGVGLTFPHLRFFCSLLVYEVYYLAVGTVHGTNIEILQIYLCRVNCIVMVSIVMVLKNRNQEKDIRLLPDSYE